MDLSGKTAVITGAASGIGRALAVEAALRGARVAAADKVSASATVREIRTKGGDAQAFLCDISDPISVSSLANQVEQAYGGVDMLAANAGVGGQNTIEKCSDDEFENVLRVNLFGTFYSIRAFAPMLRHAASADGNASILITGSEHSLGIPPYGHSTAYTTSKHALLGLADVARNDFADSGIAVTFLCPGWTLTPQITKYLDTRPPTFAPIQAMAQTPQEVAIAAWDAVNKKTFMAITNGGSRSHAMTRSDEIRTAFDRL